MDWLKLIHGETPVRVAEFTPGDDVRVWFKIREQDKERLAQFEGIVIRVRGSGSAKTFTVRRLTHGEGVERCFPLDSKLIDRIEVLRRGKAKRSRLYYLRTVVKRTRLAAADGPGGGAASEVAKSGAVPQADAQPERSPAAVGSGEPPATGGRTKP
jgi:large subunit ribosomal protein L19